MPHTAPHRQAFFTHAQVEQDKNWQKARFIEISEHFEPIFNAAIARQIVLQQPANYY